jgi:exopolysaccharide biosynthesis polyprenyl glycosylphosphotransferase
MLKQHNQLMLSLFVAADACAVVCAWLLSYWLRFEYLHVDPVKGTPTLSDNYLPMLPFVVLAHLIIFVRIGLYEPRRVNSVVAELSDVTKAFIVAIVAVIVIDYFLPATNKTSRRFIATYAVIGTMFFGLFRLSVRLLLRGMRSRGMNQRTAAIVGSGQAAQRLLRALRTNTWTGLSVRYFVDDEVGEEGRHLNGVPVLGPISEFDRVYAADPVDSVFLAMPRESIERVDDLLEFLEDTTADVRIVPAYRSSYALQPHVGELGGVPIITLRQTPLVGWNALSKRLFDIVAGSVCLVIGALPMLIIAILVKATSRGPIFYRQPRVGFDGRPFTMIKFRSMRTDVGADQDWVAQANKMTPIGNFLRRTSLDELPNLFNVLVGEMSLVGPRPERPEYIERFKREVPRTCCGTRSRPA